MAYLEELRETAKAVGVDLKGETMDQIQLLREIAKALGVKLDNSHMGVVELLSEINKVLPDVLGGGGGSLPFGQTNPDLYVGQYIEPNTVIEIDCAKLVEYCEANNITDLNAWGGDSDVIYFNLLDLRMLDDKSSYDGSLTLCIEVNSITLSFRYGYQGALAIANGVDTSTKTPKDYLEELGIIKITVGDFLTIDYRPSAINDFIGAYSDNVLNTTHNNNFIKVYQE